VNLHEDVASRCANYDRDLLQIAPQTQAAVHFQQLKCPQQKSRWIEEYYYSCAQTKFPAL
jgi:hypothetical protein